MLKNQKIHFIGIGGAGMSAIAKVLFEQGYDVSGSDLKESRYTNSLQALGVKVAIGHSPNNLNGAETVVISTAIPPHNVELTAAKEQGLTVLSRAQMLAYIANKKETVAVAGTHGKTTTTSLIAHLFQTANLNPTFLIGGELNDIGSNARHGKGKYCVVEADESDGSLINIKPKVEVITNLDTDHLDYYQSFARLVETFKQWVASLSSDGCLVINQQTVSLDELIKVCPAKVITYGATAEANYYYEVVKLTGFASQFKVYTQGKCLGSFQLNIPGQHNIENALAALALSQHLQIDLSVVKKALASFKGVKRRWQLLGKSRGITVIDDYAHHPTEIKATVKAAVNGSFKRIICIFQPHRFSRTKLLAEEYKDSFSAVDILVLTDIYSAGEQPLPGVSGKLLVDKILQNQKRPRVVYIPEKLEVKEFLLEQVKPGDLVLTIGAGDIWMVGSEILNLLAEA